MSDYEVIIKIKEIEYSENQEDRIPINWFADSDEFIEFCENLTGMDVLPEYITVVFRSEELEDFVKDGKLNFRFWEWLDLSEEDKARVAFMKYNYGSRGMNYWLDNFESVDDCYPGMSLKELAHYYVESGLFGDIPDSIERFLDFDKIAEELEETYTEIPEGCFRFI